MCALTRAIPLVAWLLFAGIVQAAAIVDQQLTPTGNFPGFAVANDRTQIQTFTVGITGAVTAIDVQVSREPLTVENLVLSLWSTDAAGLPQARLATESVAPTDPAFTSTGPRPFIRLDLTAGGVEVTAGELLAIELNSNAANNPPFNERYLWEIGGQYDRGTAYTQIGSSFFRQSDDFHFRTFVTSVPEPGTLVLLSTGLGGLLAYGWRRRRVV
jgi:PEP-CTERM motif-containing protein